MSHEATNWAVKVRGISPTEFRVLMGLADCHNPVYGCFPKQDYLAEGAEIDERSVRRCLISLRSKGHINWIEQREKDRRKANRYSLAFEAGFRAFEVLESSGDAIENEKSEPDNLSGSSMAATGQELPSEPDSGGRVNRTPESSIEPVREPVIEPVTEREGGRESDEDDPKSLRARVKAMEIGRKGSRKWPNALASSTEWATLQFSKLTPEHRRLAEERRDLYLEACPKDRDGNPKCVALGVYIKDLKFLDVEEAAAAPKPVMAAPFGKAFMARRFRQLLKGYANPGASQVTRQTRLDFFAGLIKARGRDKAEDHMRKLGHEIGDDGALMFPDDFEARMLAQHRMDNGWPGVNRLHDAARNAERVSVGAADEAFGEQFRPVKVGGDVWAAWERLHAARGWPWLPDPGRQEWVYFPAMPEGGELDEAVAAAIETFRGKVDGDADAA